MTQRPDDIKPSTDPNAYHVAQAVADAAAVQADPLSLARAAEIMTLAHGVGISMDQSRALIAAKLAAWSRADCFAAAGIADPVGGRTPQQVIEPLVWYHKDGWEHGGSAISWKDRAEDMTRQCEDATDTLWDVDRLNRHGPADAEIERVIREWEQR